MYSKCSLLFFFSLDLKKPPLAPSRTGSRMAMPMAKATGVSLLDDLVVSTHTPHSAPSSGHLAKSSTNPLKDINDR